MDAAGSPESPQSSPQGYDYRRPGAYFVTTNTVHRERLFGRFERSQLVLSAFGHIAHKIWRTLPGRFPGVAIDEFIVMPDHVHGIIWLAEHPLIEINQARSTPGARVWQRSFHESIVRSDRSLDAIRRYIRGNPVRALRGT